MKHECSNGAKNRTTGMSHSADKESFQILSNAFARAERLFGLLGTEFDPWSSMHNGHLSETQERTHSHSWELPTQVSRPTFQRSPHSHAKVDAGARGPDQRGGESDVNFQQDSIALNMGASHASSDPPL